MGSPVCVRPGPRVRSTSAGKDGEENDERHRNQGAQQGNSQGQRIPGRTEARRKDRVPFGIIRGTLLNRVRLSAADALGRRLTSHMDIGSATRASLAIERQENGRPATAATLTCDLYAFGPSGVGGSLGGRLPERGSKAIAGWDASGGTKTGGRPLRPRFASARLKDHCRFASGLVSCRCACDTHAVLPTISRNSRGLAVLGLRGYGCALEFRICRAEASSQHRNLAHCLRGRRRSRQPLKSGSQRDLQQSEAASA